MSLLARAKQPELDPDRRERLVAQGIADGLVDRLAPVLVRQVPSVCPEFRDVEFGSEVFVADWVELGIRAVEIGVVPALEEVLFELAFPVQEGVSKSQEYIEAALSNKSGGSGGAQTAGCAKLPLDNPAGCQFFLHTCPAGLIGVVVPGSRHDFELFVQAVLFHNEPREVPASMGSLFVNGYKNRRRYNRFRHAFGEGVLTPGQMNPSLWKDRFMILSSGHYSGVPGKEVGIDDDAEWIETSHRIRIEHEACHYLARRLFPQLRFGLQDEVVADFAGITEALGKFRAETFLRFMGIENYPEFRPGGRMVNYQKKVLRDEEVFAVAARFVHDAALNLEVAFSGWSRDEWLANKAQVIADLTHAPFEDLASGEFFERSRWN